MRKTRPVLVAALFPLLLAGCLVPVDRAYITDPRLPQPLNDIWLDAQHSDHELDVFRQRVHARYGNAHERSGRVERWTFDSGGTLTIDTVAGASFVTRQSEMIRLVRVRNPLGVALYGSYEMVSRPTADYGHERCWLGNVELRVDGTYAYTDSGRFLAQRRDQSANFFMLHPAGSFDVTYLNNFGPATLAESIPGGRRVAKLVFRASDGVERTYRLKMHTAFMVRQLVFEGEGMEFELDSSFL